MPIRRISAELIDEVCGSIRSLAVLNLSHNDIATIENLERLTALTRLDLSHNRLERVSGLGTLSGLTHLSLASNRIRLITGMEQLHSLETLLLSDNLIDAPAQVRTLAWLPALHSLALAGNPLAVDARHRTDVALLLPRLRFLDGGALHSGGPAYPAQPAAPTPEAPTYAPRAESTRPASSAPPSVSSAAGALPSFHAPTAGSISGSTREEPFGAEYGPYATSGHAPVESSEAERLRTELGAERRALNSIRIPHQNLHHDPNAYFNATHAAGHGTSGHAPAESSDAERLRTELAAERRAHAASRSEVEDARQSLTQAREEQEATCAELAQARALLDAALARTRASLDAELAQARALLDAERLTVRQLRAYIGTVAGKEEAGKGESGRADAQPLALAGSLQAQASFAAAGRKHLASQLHAGPKAGEPWAQGSAGAGVRDRETFKALGVAEEREGVATTEALQAEKERDREAIEALRVEKELLQMRLDAMVSLLDVQERTMSAAMGAAQAARGGESVDEEACGGGIAGGAYGAHVQRKRDCAYGPPHDHENNDALKGAMEARRLHPDADTTALLAMVHGWRQRAFELLMRAQNELRDRKRTSAHLESELAKARAGLAGAQRAADAAAAREAAAAAGLAAERACRRRAELELTSMRRALEAAQGNGREAEARSRALVRVVQTDLPAVMRAAEESMRAVGERLGPMEARLRFGLQRIGVLAVLQGAHTRPGCQRREVAQETTQLKGQDAEPGMGALATQLKGQGAQAVTGVQSDDTSAPPAQAGHPNGRCAHAGMGEPMTGSVASVGSPSGQSAHVGDASSPPQQIGVSSGLSTHIGEQPGTSLHVGDASLPPPHVAVEMERLLDERSVLLRRIDGWAAAEATRAQAAAEVSAASVRKAEAETRSAFEALHTAQSEVAELRRALEAEQTRALATVAPAQVAAAAEREAAAEARREASAAQKRNDDSRLVLQQAVSSLQAELLRTRDEIERNSRLSAQRREEEEADREALRVRTEQAEVRHVACAHACTPG
jgi:hypothetical protein